MLAAQTPLQPFTPAAYGGGGLSSMWQPAGEMTNTTQGVTRVPQEVSLLILCTQFLRESFD